MRNLTRQSTTLPTMRSLIVGVTLSVVALVGCAGAAESDASTASATMTMEATQVAEATRTAEATAATATVTARTPTAPPTLTSTATPAPTESPAPTPAATLTATLAPSTPPPVVAQPPTPAPPPPGGVTANIQGFGYPYELQVVVGTTVTWVNLDTALHDVAAYDGTWSSVLLAQGESYSRTFTTAGRFAYTCSIHPYMQAAVVVQ